jgi:hypothetical protein
MNQFQKNIKSNALNEDRMLANIYARAEKDGLRSGWAKAPKESVMKKRGLIYLGLAFVLTFTIIVSNPLNWFAKDNSNVVAAIVSVDINPSFELSVNNAGLVIKIDALNVDAQSLDTADLIGMPIEEAVDAIVVLAAEAGFIDLTDLEDDYIVVSTVVSEGTPAELGDTLQTRLHDRIQLSDTLQCINFVQIKATLQEQAQARDEDIPVGLYVINGMIQTQNGELLTVREFFADDENKLAIQTRAQITEVTLDKIRERLETALNTLDQSGVDTTELRTRLENAGTADMIQIQSEVKNQINKPDDSGNGNGNGAGTQEGNGTENQTENRTNTETQTGTPTETGSVSETGEQSSDSETGGSGLGGH